jgi:hypothetical protein
MKYFICLILTLAANLSIAWNAVGHRLVAQIAFDNITHKNKKLYYKYNAALNARTKRYSLVNSAVWLDNLYSRQFKDLRPLHYIDIPIAINSNSKQTNKYNVVFAINLAKRILQSNKFTIIDKSIAFRILLHTVGDIHQPLHAASKFDSKNPNGDRGGNLVVIKNNKTAKNLHSYWDRGAGALIDKKRYTAFDIRQIAKKIEGRWPCASLNVDFKPMSWALESHDLAINFAYKLPINKTYQKQAVDISLKQIAIAGCRLAAIL